MAYKMNLGKGKNGIITKNALKNGNFDPFIEGFMHDDFNNPFDQINTPLSKKDKKIVFKLI